MRKDRLLRFHAELKSQITSKTSQDKTQVKSRQFKLKSMELRYTSASFEEPSGAGFRHLGADAHAAHAAV